MTKTNPSQDDSFDIAMVGSHAYGIYISCDRLPGRGETVMGYNFIPHADDGGKGSNQAICAGRLGAKVLFIGKVGNDEPADIVTRWLRESNVDMRYLYRSEKTYTGLGIVLVDKAGDVLCAVDMGANKELTSIEIEAARETMARARFFLTQFELPADIALFGVRLAKKLGLTTVVTPGPVPALKDGDLAAVDIITPNETEGNILAGFVPDAQTDPVTVVKRVQDRWCVRNVIMTLGEKGVCALCNDQIVRVPAFEVSPVNTAGAGDAFTAGLVTARCRGASWEQAIEFGSALAAISIQSSAPWRGYPTLEQVADFLRQRGRPVPKFAT